AEDGIRDFHVTGVQTCALPISAADAYQRLRDEGVEAFLLSTCLRVEVAVAGGDDLARSALQALYGRSPRPVEVRHEREAFLHLRSEERRVGKDGRAETAA